MDKEKNYVFYTLSSKEDEENIRYIGVTTTSLGVRLSQHKYVAKNSKKRSTPIAKWIFNLQTKNIDVIIKKIDECKENEWEIKEKTLIIEYKLKYNLLNVDEGGKGVITLEKRSKSGLIRSAEAHEIKIVQLDLKGNYIKTFDSSVKAANEMGLNSNTAINNVLKGRSKTSCNFYWVYETDYLNNSYNLNNPINLKETRGIKHYQYCPETFKLINTFLSINDLFYEITGVKGSNASTLKKSIKNKTTWNDYFWTLEKTNDFSSFYNDTFKVLEIDKNSKIINKFRTNIDAGKFFNLADSTISNYIRNKTITKNNTYIIKNNKEIKI